MSLAQNSTCLGRMSCRDIDAAAFKDDEVLVFFSVIMVPERNSGVYIEVVDYVIAIPTTVFVDRTTGIGGNDF